MTTLSSQFAPEIIRATKAKIVKRNTFKRIENGEEIIRLHGTDIVTKHVDGSVTLNSGGWKTLTTKDRMNACLPMGYQLFSDKGQWFVANWQDSGRKNATPYFDGMRVPQDCEKPKPKGEKAAKQEAKLRADIKRFLAKLDKLEQLPAPSSGDCFYCRMRTEQGEALGDAVLDTDHLLSHIKEGYLHGSLIMNALRFVGYGSPALIWQMENRDRADGRKTDWAKRALRKYLYRKLGLVS